MDIIPNIKCLICQKDTTNNKLFCSKECRSSESGKKLIYEKKKTKWLKTLGTDNPQKSKQVRDKTKQTNTETYGNACYLHSKQGIEAKKITWKKNYGDDIENPMQSDIVKKRTLNTWEKNGYSNPQRCPSIRKQTEKTCEERYGVKSPLSSPIIQSQITETNKEVHGGPRPACDPVVKARTRATCEKRYNGSSPMSSPVVRDKVVKTCEKTMDGAKSPFEYEPIKQQIAQTNIENLGVPNPFMSKKIQERIKKYNLATLGHVNPFGSPMIQQKIQQIFIDKYGVTNPNKLDFVRDKISKTKFGKYYHSRLLNLKIVKPLFSPEDYIGNNQKYLWLCLECNKQFDGYIMNGIIPRCLACHPILTGTSNIERELQEWLEQYIPIERNKRYFENGKYKYELDIFIPSKNIGIEYDGLYHHSELNGCKHPNYHLDKSQYFAEKGIFVIHVFANEWESKQDIVKSVILSKLGLIKEKIYARKCRIKELSNKDLETFTNDNHLQGHVNAKIKLGLCYQNSIVSIMTFGKPRFNKKFEWELLRYCNKTNMNIFGGFSRLLNYFYKNYNPKSLLTYADKRYSDGNVYFKNGFELIDASFPNYFYIEKYHILHSRIQFQKHKLQSKLKIFNPQLTEWENMQINGFDRIWDCGNLVFAI